MLAAQRYVPQCIPDRRPLITWSLVAAGAFVVVALLFAAPVARANGSTSTAFLIYEIFSHVCHQSPERSFFVAGNALAVCARCTGLYVGFAAAVVAYPFLTSLKRIHTPDRKWLFIAATPLAIDFALGFLGIWENTHTSRFLTGALLAAVSVFFIMPGLVQLSLYQRLFRPTGTIHDNLRNTSTKVTSEEVAASPSDYSAPLRRI
jgi:uncharacterized membrane protein